MTRLDEKLAAAAAVAPRQAAKIEARADALIAREVAIEKRTDEAFAPHESVLTIAEGGLDKLEDSLKLLSNETPLALSKGSPIATQQPGSGASTEPGIASGADVH